MPSTSSNPPRPDDSPLLRRATSLGYQVNHLARSMEAALRTRIAPLGVAPGQFAQLLALYEQDGVSQSELCRAVQIDQSTMALTLRRMERDGLVSRRPSQRDRRSTEIWLTERARTLEARLVECAQEVNALAGAGVSKADMETTLRVIGQLIDNLAVSTARTEP